MSAEALHPVTAQEFWGAMNGRDAVTRQEGRYPYTSCFETRARRLIGEIRHSIPPGTATPVPSYFLAGWAR